MDKNQLLNRTAKAIARIKNSALLIASVNGVDPSVLTRITRPFGNGPARACLLLEAIADALAHVAGGVLPVTADTTYTATDALPVDDTPTDTPVDAAPVIDDGPAPPSRPTPRTTGSTGGKR
jgi:hypothetical protein